MGLIAINYHYIRDHFNFSYPSIFGITPKQLESQIQLIKSSGSVIHPDQIITSCNNPENSFLITFDDGLKEQFVNALPILKKNEIHAIFYIPGKPYLNKKVLTVHLIHVVRSLVPSDKILTYIKSTSIVKKIYKTQKLKIEHGKNHYRYDEPRIAELKYLLNFILDPIFTRDLFKFYFEKKLKLNQVKACQKLYMSIDQVKKLNQFGYVGYHGQNHLPLGTINSVDAKIEIEKNIEVLAKYNVKSKHFSYPYGSREAIGSSFKLLKDYGIETAFTMIRGINTKKSNNFLLKRFDNNDAPGGKNHKNYRKYFK